MFKKTKFAITATVLLLISGSNACTDHSGLGTNCTGNYNENVNTVFYECFNERGVLESKS